MYAVRSCCRQLRTQARSKQIRHISIKSTTPSSYPSKGSFPLDLPQDFEFNPRSVIYSEGHLQAQSAHIPTTLAVCNPATEETLIQIEVASKNDIETSIDDAQNIFTSGVWSRADPTERFLVLNQVAALLRKHSNELAARIPQIIHIN